MSEMHVLLEGLGIPESTRWHDERIWLCNWGAGEVVSVTPSGEPEVIAQVAPSTLPFSIDWLPDGRLLIVDGPRRLLLALQPDVTLDPIAELSVLGDGFANELVVDGAGNAYVNGGAGSVVRVTPDGRVDKVADGLKFPNGMALVNHDRTLIVADSYARTLVAYELDSNESRSAGHVWAELEHAPDGICADTEGAIWIATVPGERCVRVREGGEVLDTISTDRGCFACMLGGKDGRTLFIATAEWQGMDALMSNGPGLTGQLIAVPNQPAAHADRP